MVDVKIRGTKEAIQMLDNVSKKLDDLRPVAPELQASLREVFRKMFETRGAYGGTPWAPLSAHTMFDKLVKGESSEPLRATDTLFRALTEGHRGNDVATKDTVGVGIFGRTGWYGRFAQTGTRYAPSRPLVPEDMPDADVNDLVDIILHRAFGL